MDKALLLIPIILALVFWIMPFESIMSIISTNPIQMVVDTSFMDNQRFQKVSISNFGWESVSNIEIYLDSIGDIGEVQSNSCTNSNIEFDEIGRDADIKFETFWPDTSCSIIFKSESDNYIFHAMIVGEGLSEKEWTRSGQDFQIAYKIMGVVFAIVFGILFYKIIKIIRKNNVVLSLTAQSVKNLSEEFGYNFSKTHDEIVDAIRQGNLSVNNISHFLNKPKSQIRKELKFLEKTGVVYWDD